MKTVNVAAAIIHENNRVFATQRGYGDYKDGWEFPGGKVEAGESEEAAIVREIKEELDTEIEVEEKLCHVEYDYAAFHLSMACFLCHVKGGKLTLLEHEAAKWVTRDDIWCVDWLPADRECVEKLLGYTHW